MEKLLDVMRKLRAPEGCPWDREQTHLSLRQYLLEEAAEAVDAITAGDVDEVTEELGDVLLQVAFHSVIGEQEQTFTYEDVENAIVEKLIRRHPHVFGNVQADTPDVVVENWNAIKKSEGKSAKSVADQVPRSLGALHRAMEIQQKLKISDTTRETLVEAMDRGDLAEALWNLVGICRKAGLNAELVLRERCDALRE